MTVKYSEQQVSRALRVAMELEDVFVYKPPDQAFAANTKPADYMLWWLDGELGTAWLEVKQNPDKTVFPLSAIAPSQWAGMRTAAKLGLPYWLAIYWPGTKVPWTFASGSRLLQDRDSGVKSIKRADFLWDSKPADLGSTLRACLLDE